MKQNLRKRLFNGLKKNKDNEKKPNLTYGMIRLIILCLFIPYLALSVVLFYYSEIKTGNRIRETVVTSMENAADIFNINIDNAVAESKKSSYDGVIRKSYNQYKKTNSEADLYNEVSSYLKTRYKYNSLISNTIVLFHEDLTSEFYTYSDFAGASYANINFFKEYAKNRVLKTAEDLGTDTELVVVGKHLYLVRNMVQSDYTPFAVFVTEINVDYMFKSVENVSWEEAEIVFIDGNRIEPSKEKDIFYKQELLTYAEEHKDLLQQKDNVSYYDQNNSMALLTMHFNGQTISYIVKLNKMEILNERSAVIYPYIVLAILSIILVYVTIRYFYKNITKPISGLMVASEKIEEGEYGYRMEDFNDNQEFGKMVDTFNHMSVSLKDSFNRIYTEEIALRDANMKALQAQINPHFLNNTLEIINWKARMSGNDDVSGMIESLGIMMEATMNRKNESFITIREEMRYVDAYLYIIEQRFGQKFRFEKEIDDSVLELKIPRLIVQPIVENMVDHGGDMYGNRRGKLKIYADDKHLHIVVENNGDISYENKEKIRKLLEEHQLESDMHNIGIHNVNLRLKMLYGENSGLTITNTVPNVTVSEIVIEKKKLDEVLPVDVSQKAQEN